MSAGRKLLPVVSLGVAVGALVLVFGCAAQPAAPVSTVLSTRVHDGSAPDREDLERLMRRVDAIASRSDDLENAVARVGARVEALERRMDHLAALLAHARASRSPSAAGGGAVSPPPSSEPGGIPRSPTGGAKAPGVDTKTSAEDLYQTGVSKFKERDLDAAVLVLYDLITTYPDHPLRENAQLLVGDIFFSQKDLRGALREFEELLVAVPRGAKTAEALLKIGLCQRGLGDEATARRTWERLINEHTKSVAARQARALLREARRR